MAYNLQVFGTACAKRTPSSRSDVAPSEEYESYWLRTYAKAEAYFLEHALTIPCYYGIGWCLTKVDNDSKMFAMYGCQNEKMKNWETNSEGYTSAEKGVAEQIAAFTEQQTNV